MAATTDLVASSTGTTTASFASASVSTVLLLCGAIHLIPAVGILGPVRLESLYGIKLGADPNLNVLLRHRALLFGLLGIPLTMASFHPAWQHSAIAAGLVSTASFIALCRLEAKPVNAHLRRVCLIDGFVVGGLLLSAGLLYWQRRS